MGMLEQGLTWIEQQRQKNLCVPVEYIRRDKSRVRLNATIGRTVFRAENLYGITVRTESRDFLIAASEMPQIPERGEQIIYNGNVYEVLAPNSEPCWRWSGTQHQLRRIHTKETGGVTDG